MYPFDKKPFVHYKKLLYILLETLGVKLLESKTAWN